MSACNLFAKQADSIARLISSLSQHDSKPVIIVPRFRDISRWRFRPLSIGRIPTGCRVVGVDLAGYEDISTRAHYFREEFTGVHRCGLALTVHAGENDVAEGIWRAVFDLNARRLGHALHLIDSPELMRSVADRGIGVEMCPYANYQIKGFHPMPPSTGGSSRPDYPLKRYLEAGIRATVSTDNIGISGASLTDNLLLAAELCPGLTRLDVLRLQRNAIETAFLSPASRTEVLKRAESRLPFASEDLNAVRNFLIFSAFRNGFLYDGETGGRAHSCLSGEDATEKRWRPPRTSERLLAPQSPLRCLHE